MPGGLTGHERDSEIIPAAHGMSVFDVRGLAWRARCECAGIALSMSNIRNAAIRVRTRAAEAEIPCAAGMPCHDSLPGSA